MSFHQYGTLVLFLFMIFPAVQAAGDGGHFNPVWSEVSNPDYKELQAELQKEHVLEELASELNEAINLPADITLTFGECEVANAFYSPDKKTIVICYELLERFEALFKPDMKSEEELEEAVLGAGLFVFYHEVGHALVDVLNLPITGKEEDAVDQLSATILLSPESPEEEPNAASVLHAAFWFLRETEESGHQSIEDLPFYDEHSLNPTRFFNLVCWVYGSDSSGYAWLVKENILPQERGDRCGSEFNRFSSAWEQLLADHLKK